MSITSISPQAVVQPNSPVEERFDPNTSIREILYMFRNLNDSDHARFVALKKILETNLEMKERIKTIVQELQNGAVSYRLDRRYVMHIQYEPYDMVIDEGVFEDTNEVTVIFKVSSNTELDRPIVAQVRFLIMEDVNHFIDF